MSERDSNPPVERTELERFTGRTAPTEAERRIAARVVLKTNKARDIETPGWIRALARSETK